MNSSTASQAPLTNPQGSITTSSDSQRSNDLKESSSLSTVVQAFKKAVLLAIKESSPAPAKWWHRRLAFQDARLTCAYCGVALIVGPGSPEDVEARISYLVPLYQSGPLSNENRLAACPHCTSAKRHTDWLLSSPPAHRKPGHHLYDLRILVLSKSSNHLLRDPADGRKKATVLKRLGSRWEHPRFVAWAAMTSAGGFISLSGPNAYPADMAAALTFHGGTHTGGKAWSFPAYPHPSFLNAVWCLIEHNGLVRQVDLGEVLPDPTQASDGEAQWAVTYSSVGDIRRRRPKAKPIRLRATEKPMDWGLRLLMEYEISREQNREFDWEWVNRHKSSDMAWEHAQRARQAKEADVLAQMDARPFKAAKPSPIDQFNWQQDQRITGGESMGSYESLALRHGLVLQDPVSEA